MSTPYDPTLILLGLNCQKLFGITPQPYDSLQVKVKKCAATRGLSNTPYDKLEKMLLDIYNTLSDDIDLDGGGTPTPGPSVPALTNLVAYWKMDETSGNRLDSSGNGHTLVPAGTVNMGSGRINGGAIVTGGTSHLGITSSDFSGASPFTAAAWILTLGSVGLSQPAVGHYTSSGFGNGWLIHHQSSDRFGLRLANGVGGQMDINHTTATIRGLFYLVIVTINGTTCTIRVNNGADVSNTFTPGNPSVQFRVGEQGVLQGTSNMVVDEVGIWNRVLTSDEKLALWNSGAGKQYPFPS